jgi:uncharacterized protein
MNRVPVWLLAVVLTLVGAACGTKPADPDAEFARALQAERNKKDAGFASAENSPIPAADRGKLLPLKYFPPDPSYAIPAAFVPAAVRTHVQTPTSAGKIRDMEIVGRLEFTIGGKSLSLVALTEPGTPPDRLFIPFSDLTSGTETYSAGRYLDIERSKTGIYIVDFNRAFNPYCAYNHDFDCPYPPRENRLPLPIRAGERMPQTNVPISR